MNNFIKKIFPVIDGLIIAGLTLFVFAGLLSSTRQLLYVILWILVISMITLYAKGFYDIEKYHFKDIYKLFECTAISVAISLFVAFILATSSYIGVILAMLYIGIFTGIITVRVLYLILGKLFNRTKNVLIVGAGQDGKLIAEEIQQRPELGLNVVGFLDDNMNNIEDEDSSIPILGLTCDSDAVVKDNNVKIIIIAVKSRMDSNILTDLVKGIPLGVKVWRMYRFYEKITHKFLVSKMSVNWLFYDCVRKKALLYANLKRICDIIASLAILIITLPISLIAMLGIKLSDLGPIFYTQMRAGKFGKPFKLIKFRSMYHEKVEKDFDEDINEIHANDLRIMPFCKLLGKFHIDELPQMINVLKGDMSIVGPRPVREEVNEENSVNIPFWECRNWVRPGWCGWQQVKVKDPSAEERLGYDLYYIKHRNVCWEFALFVRFIIKILTGKAGK